METHQELTDCRYQFYTPSDFLKPYVRGYTFTEGFDQFANASIYGLSTGLPELLFHYQDSELYSLDDSNDLPVRHKGCLVGSYQLCRPHRIFYKKIKMMSIHLHHNSVALLLGIPLAEIPHHAVEITDLAGDRTKSLIDYITNAKTNEKRIEIIESYFKKQLVGFNVFNDTIAKYLANIFLMKDTPNRIIHKSNKLFYLRRPYVITNQKNSQNFHL